MSEQQPTLYDPVTGLASPALFFDRLTHGRDRASRDDRLLGLLIVEVDGVEELDDEVRDKVLKAASRRIRSCVRKVDTAARTEGSRFAVIVEGATTRDQITDVANKIVHQLDQPFVFETGKAEVAASVGVSIYPSDATDTERLLWNAETAAIKARNEGGSSFRLFDESYLSE